MKKLLLGFLLLPCLSFGQKFQTKDTCQLDNVFDFYWMTDSTQKIEFIAVTVLWKEGKTRWVYKQNGIIDTIWGFKQDGYTRTRWYREGKIGPKTSPYK